MPCEVKSLAGTLPSPAPSIATFSQAPSQPQAASQTLTPLTVQAAPQVRAAWGWTGGSGQQHRTGVAMGPCKPGRQDGGGSLPPGALASACPSPGSFGKVDLHLPGSVCGSKKTVEMAFTRLLPDFLFL